MKETCLSAAVVEVEDTVGERVERHLGEGYWRIELRLCGEGEEFRWVLESRCDWTESAAFICCGVMRRSDMTIDGFDTLECVVADEV
jgi:hypothetical protein